MRGFLGLAGVAAAPALIGGCAEDAASRGSGATPRPSGTSTAGRSGGGTVRVGALGAATDTLNPLTTTGFAGYTTLVNIYDSLAQIRGASVERLLLESAEPNEDASIWTLRIRPGVRFHDGRALTAADVAYSLQAIGDPTRAAGYAPAYADVDAEAIRVEDDTTLTVPLRRPRGDLLETVLASYSPVFPAGTADDDWGAGVGSGPFRLAEYDAGRSTRLERNPDHWAGAPEVEVLEVVSITDPDARLNAVRSGEISYALGVPAAAVASAGGDGMQILRGGPENSNALMFAMNVTQTPFDDPNVRLALKLLTDRQALVDTVLFGQGQVGNDVVGLGLPGYLELPQRGRDVDRARELLGAAGVSELTLRAADIIPGLVDAARLFAAQVRDAGLDVDVEQAPADTYFADFETLFATPFQTMTLTNRSPAATISISTGSAASFNITGYGGTDYDAALTDAQATVDDAERDAKFADLQRRLHDDGGEIVWGFAEQLSATDGRVSGVTLYQSIPIFGDATVTG